MQLRRALIAFAVVLVAATAIASLSASDDEASAPDVPASPGPRALAPNAVTVALRHPVEAAPPVRTVPRGAHVILRVQAALAGNVEVAGLGLVESVAPGTPAVFDILAERSGRYDVSLASVAAERTKLGTLVVAE